MNIDIEASKSIIIITIIVIISLYLLYRTPSVSYNLMDEYYNNGGVLTTNIKSYKDLFNKKVEYIKENSNFLLDPADENILNQMRDKINNNKDSESLINVFISSINMPGNTIGYTPMTSWEDPSKKICLQLEQGIAGWYWLYGTFPKTKDCFLYQLTRVDLLPTKLRKKLGYRLGETTVYCVTLGIGNGNTYYYGNIYFEGSLTILDNENFSIISKDKNYSFTHSLDKMTVFCKNMMLKNNQNENDKLLYNFSSQTYNYFGMSLNFKNGCEPCDLTNNSYQSYTNLYLNMSYNNSNGLTKNLTEGNGWMDHEWVAGDTKRLFYKLFIPILQKGKLSQGLPPYIWLNIRLSDNLQYMIYSFFSNPPKKGDSVVCNYNKYQPSGVSFSSENSTINVKIIDTVSYLGVEYPSVYEVNIEGNTYILNSTSYGKTIFKDVFNTNHWGGSCDVFKDNKQVGVGFMEAQRFDKSIDSLRDTFILLGYDKNSNFAETYNNTTYKSQLYTSYTIFIVLFILLAFILYHFIKYIVSKISKTLHQ